MNGRSEDAKTCQLAGREVIARQDMGIDGKGARLILSSVEQVMKTLLIADLEGRVGGVSQSIWQAGQVQPRSDQSRRPHWKKPCEKPELIADRILSAGTGDAHEIDIGAFFRACNARQKLG